MRVETSVKGTSQKRRTRFLSLTGFTLIELIVVIALVAVIAGLATVRFMQSFEARSTDQYVKELTSYLRYVQFRAIEEGQAYRLGVAEEGKGLTTSVADSSGKFAETRLPHARKLREDSRMDIRLKKGNGVFFFPDGTVTGNAFEISDSSGRLITVTIKNRLGIFEVKDHA